MLRKFVAMTAVIGSTLIWAESISHSPKMEKSIRDAEAELKAEQESLSGTIDIIYGGTVISEYSPANYSISTDGDTVLLLPDLLPVDIPESHDNTNTDTTGWRFWTDVNIQASSYTCYHPALAKYSSIDLYCACETDASGFNGIIRVRRSIDGGLSWTYFGGFTQSTTVPLLFPEIGVTSTRVVVTCHEFSTNHSYSVTSPRGSSASWNFYYLDADANVRTPDVVGVGADQFYAAATYLYSSTDQDVRFYKTTNYGVNWTRTTLLGAFPDSRAHWRPRVAVDPSNNSKVGVTWMTGSDSVGVALSTNAGSTWAFYWITPVSNTPRYPDIAIAGNNVVVAYDYGNYLKMHYSTNFGGAWSSIYTTSIPNPVEYPVINTDGGCFFLAYVCTADHCLYYDWATTPGSWHTFVEVTDPTGYARTEPPAVCGDPENYLYGFTAWADSRSTGDIWGDAEAWPGIAEDQSLSALPKDYSLCQNRPNPVALRTSIDYFLPTDRDVQLHVFDVAGRQIAELANGFKEAGSHQVSWDIRSISRDNLPNGIYFYRLRAGDFEATKKMIVCR